jgi:BolA protein
MNDRIARIRERLDAALTPQDLEIQDDSHRHVGHAGARGGAGHYTVRVTAAAFAGKPLLERHRMIYAALQDMMHGEIHALSIQAHSPNE